MARPHTAQLVEAKAECQRCTWTADGKNAQALAAQHFDRQRHPVRVRTTMEITYGQADSKTRSPDGQGNLL